MVIIIIALLDGGWIAAQNRPAKPSLPPDVSYVKDVIPILRTNCVFCHSESGGTMSGLDLTTYEGLMKGGDNGPVLLPGRGSESRMILQLEGKAKPKMPPKGDLKPAEIVALRTWISAGAPAPPPGTVIAVPLEAGLASIIPAIKPLTAILPQVSAVAFSPDGGVLAAAGYKEVRLIDPQRGAVMGTLKGPADIVRSLAYSSDGRQLAGGGGAPAQFGEVCLWDVATGSLLRTLKGHKDYVYSLAFSPDNQWLATASYDKLVKIWDAGTGAELRTLKDHTDAVYAVAFSRNGSWLASGSADRTVKLWNAANGRRLFTLNDATDVIYSLAFHPSGQELSAASADKTIRTWKLTAQGGTLIQSIIAHEDAIHKIAYTPDGRHLVSTGADRAIKFWDLETGLEGQALEAQPDWALDLAYSPDGRRLAVGRYDGSVSIYDSTNRQRLHTPIAPAADR